MFLTQEMPFAGEVIRPIDRLKQGEIDEVVGAAAGWGQLRRDSSLISSRSGRGRTNLVSLKHLIFL